MRIMKEDPTLDALIDQYNEQAGKAQWDAAFGSATAIAELYEERAIGIKNSIILQLRIGVINRAKASAQDRTNKKRKK